MRQKPFFSYMIFLIIFFSFPAEWMQNPFDRVMCGDMSGKFIFPKVWP